MPMARVPSVTGACGVPAKTRLDGGELVCVPAISAGPGPEQVPRDAENRRVFQMGPHGFFLRGGNLELH